MNRAISPTLPSAPSALLVSLGAALIGGLTLLAVAVPPWSAIAVLAGVVGLLVLLSRLDLAFCFLIASEVLISEDILLRTEKLYPTLYRSSLPGIPINPFEAVLIVLLLATVLASRGRLVRTSLDVPLLGFAVACLVGYLTCIRLTGEPERLFEPRRILHFYLSFFLTVNIIRSRTSLRLLMWIFAVAVILKSLEGIYLIWAGGGLEIKWRIRAIFTGWGDGINFITYLVFVLLLLLRRPEGVSARWWVLFWPVVLITLVNTYKRAYYLGLAGALGCLFLLEGGRRRFRFLLVCAVTLAILAAVVTATEKWYAVTQSVWSIFHPTKESSAYYRLVEWQNALISIHRRPWLGIGLGGILEMVVFLPRTNLLGVHNTYLWVAVKMGAIGLVAYLWLILSFTWRLMRQRRDLTDSFRLWVNQGLLLSYLAFLVAQCFAPMFSQMRTSTWMGLIMGVGVMLPYLHNNETARQERSPDTP